MAVAKKSKPVTAADIRTLEAQWHQLDIERLELTNEQLRLKNKLIKTSDAARGVFAFSGEAVDDDIVHELIRQMGVWSRNHPGAPITLVINSPGGVVLSGFALYDFLEELKRAGHHLTTKAIGCAASMGSILFQAGDERVISPRAWVLIHEVQGLVAGSFSQMEDDMRFNERLQTQALDILAARSKLSARTIKTRWKRKDWWLDAHDAVKHGFADRIET